MNSELIWMRSAQSKGGRPATRSQEEITQATVRVADREGLAGVTMRHVAAELNTGAGTLYRYVENRDDLLDLIADYVAGEYDLTAPCGDWLADLVDLGLQAREIYRRHPWLAELVLTRPAVGPNGVNVMEYFLAVLADHPASDDTKLVAQAVSNSIVASHAHFEASPFDTMRSARYIAHVAAEGKHPNLAALKTQGTQSDPLPDALRGALSGLLGCAGTVDSFKPR